MKLAMIRRIPHPPSGEAKPLTPVQDHALSVFAISVAPRFKRNSDTSTQATLRTSCSQGLPKPEGRFCIRFFLPFVMSSEVETSLVSEGIALKRKTKNQRFLHFGRNHKIESAPASAARLRADRR